MHTKRPFVAKRRDDSNMHIDSRLPYELLALETALAACSRGLEAEANEIEVCYTRQPLGCLRLFGHCRLHPEKTS